MAWWVPLLGAGLGALSKKNATPGLSWSGVEDINQPTEFDTGYIDDSNVDPEILGFRGNMNG